VTAILGISAFYHDSAAALVVDGRIVAAAQEERFSRKKHDAGFPARAIGYCLAEAGMKGSDLDYVAFYEKPLARLDRILESFLAAAPAGFWSFWDAVPVWLKEKLHVRSRINGGLARSRRPIVFPSHHESHAASAFFPSPFAEAAILTLDGVGEWSTASIGTGRGNRICLTHELRYPHSLGLLYSAFTAYCGFEVNDGEYKLMGLAACGDPVYRDLILQRLIDVKPDGSFRLNTDYFRVTGGKSLTNRRFDRLLGGPPRQRGEPITRRHKDLAASVQAVTEEVLLRLGTELHRRTGLDRLTMAGGVALNCVANSRLLGEGPFSQIWIQPAAGDAGGALGAALFVWHQLLGRPRDAAEGDRQQGSFLGPRFMPEEIGAYLAQHAGGRYVRLPRQELIRRVAQALADGQVVGWFTGRMEYGPRALGARSILADPRRAPMRDILNDKIKQRESFRPFGPAVLAEEAGKWFVLPKGQESPYMLLTAPLSDLPREESAVPAVTHVDGSARIQTVDAGRNEPLHELLTEFCRLTGCPMLVNTSFNRAGEPIVCTPEDALRCFEAAGLDLLVIEDFLVTRSAPAEAEHQPAIAKEAADALA
jgi:carbamoyltransferase